MPESAVRVAENIGGKCDHRLGKILNNFALVNESLSRHEQAISLYMRAVEVFKKNKHKELSDYGITLNNVARLYVKMQLYDLLKRGWNRGGAILTSNCLLDSLIDLIDTQMIRHSTAPQNVLHGFDTYFHTNNSQCSKD